MHHLIVVQGKMDKKFSKTTNKQGNSKTRVIVFLQKMNMVNEVVCGSYDEVVKTLALAICSPFSQNMSGHCCENFDLSYYIKFCFAHERI